jgi:hypothetical protein
MRAKLSLAVLVTALLAVVIPPTMSSAASWQPLNLQDDDSVLLNLPFTYRFCGTSYSSVYVNSNGSLTFGEGDWWFVESADGFLQGPPRIAGFWDDLNPAAGGSIAYLITQNAFRVRFQDVPEFFDFGAATFEIALNRGSSQIDVAYGGSALRKPSVGGRGPEGGKAAVRGRAPKPIAGSLTAPDGLVGVTCGRDDTTGAEQESDLTRGATRTTLNMARRAAVYEWFDPFTTPGDVNDLGGYHLRFTNVKAPV